MIISPLLIKNSNTMFVLHSFPVAVVFTVVTMICWGSWANTLKLVKGNWPFALYYWDYVFGIVLMSLLMGLTLGSTGTEGRSFM